MTYKAEFELSVLKVLFYIELHGERSDCKDAAVFLAAQIGGRFTGILEPVEKPNDR